ncbi:MAG: T9SS type A sorting domain-containing protein [Saprospiraceae bacterium]|nr:T9SS type A sorting domain-containing protein [Saprospiraceae bacterium]MBP7679416.1 T9SS type A sorting domain-containing protein [Saprospiraceae bacterium]
MFLLITLLPVGAFAQSIKSLLSYEVTETSYYKLPPDVAIQSVSMLDLVKMKFTTQTKQVEKKITTQNDLTTTTIYTQPTTDETSLKRNVTKSIVDKDGVKMYGANNVLLQSISYTAAELASYNAIKNQVAALTTTYGLNAKLKPLTTADATALQDNGYAVDIKPTGEYEVGKGDIRTVVNPTHQVLEQHYYKDGALTNTVIQRYTLTEDGEHIVPVSKVEKLYETTPSGLCWEYITEQRYRAYKINGVALRSNFADNSEVSNINVYPNPTSDAINIELPLIKDGDNLYNIMIINSLGNVLQSYTARNEQTVRLATEGLSAGMYYVFIEHKGMKTVKHFVKISE